VSLNSFELTHAQHSPEPWAFIVGGGSGCSTNTYEN